MAVKPRFDGEWVRLDEVACINPKQPRGLGATDKVSFLPLAEVNMDGTTNLGIESVRSEVSKGHPWFVDGDLLLAKITPSFENGKIALASTAYGEGYTSTEFHIIRPDDKLVVREFLLAYLRSRNVERYCAARMKGSAGQKRVPVEVLKRLQVPAIPLEAQRGIASQFGSISRQLNDCKTQLEMLDDLVKSRFVEMFGDPCDPDSSKFPVLLLKDICDLRIGPFGSALHKGDYITGGHPLVNPSHIISGCIEVDSSLTVGEEKYASMGPYHLQKGDVVLGRRGEIGRCAVVDVEGLLCGTGSMILRPHTNMCLSDYLQRVVSFPSFSTSLERRAVGVTMKNLNAKIVGNAMVVLPPLALQWEFADFADSVDKSRFMARRAMENLMSIMKTVGILSA